MSDQPSFSVPASAQSEETTGRYIVTFRDDATTEGLAALKKHGGVSKVASAADFKDSALKLEKLDSSGAAVFPTLGIAVVEMGDEALSSVSAFADVNSPILAVEPERIFYALAADGTLPFAYLEGYRDAINHIYEKSKGGEITEEGAEVTATYVDDSSSTWGLKATRANTSRFTGRGIKVAVLDTGFDLTHPDFLMRSKTTQSFISGEDVQDGNSHGTHCIGTSCGAKDSNGRLYGIAREASIFAGKVLSNAGSGPTAGILAGMEWAIRNGCQVISMSLGNLVSTPSPAYEAAGRRALQNKCLVVAAAGNHRATANPTLPGTVGQPANSPSIMAVAAVNNQLRLASFSASSGVSTGAKIDISGPGVNVYSSVPMPRRYDGTFSGTSMATPHVAGCAALWAQANRARGPQLWQLLVSHAMPLRIPAVDVGAGLVQAPQ